MNLLNQLTADRDVLQAKVNELNAAISVVSRYGPLPIQTSGRPRKQESSAATVRPIDAIRSILNGKPLTRDAIVSQLEGKVRTDAPLARAVGVALSHLARSKQAKLTPAGWIART